MRPIVFAAAVAALVTAPACDKKGGGGDDRQANAGKATATPPAQPPAPAEPTGPTAAQTLERYQRCNAAINAADAAAITKCYAAEGSELQVLDSLEGARAQGSAAIANWFASIAERVSDYEGTPQLTMAGPEWVAAIRLDTGVIGGKKVSTLAAQLVWFDESMAITRDLRLTDEATVLSQIGKAPSPMAPAAEAPWPEPVVVTALPADKSRVETNVQIVANVERAMAERAADTFAAHLADDVRFRYAPHKATVEGKQAYIDSITRLSKMFSKMERKLLGSMGAGDWVVVHSLVTATPAADLPDAPGSAGKPVTTHQIEFYKLEGGAITRHWVFENSAQWAKQLAPASGVNGGGDSKP